MRISLVKADRGEVAILTAVWQAVDLACCLPSAAVIPVSPLSPSLDHQTKIRAKVIVKSLQGPAFMFKGFTCLGCVFLGNTSYGSASLTGGQGAAS